MLTHNHSNYKSFMPALHSIMVTKLNQIPMKIIIRNHKFFKINYWSNNIKLVNKIIHLKYLNYINIFVNSQI